MSENPHSTSVTIKGISYVTTIFCNHWTPFNISSVE